MLWSRTLDQVFNLGSEPSRHTYLDRGGLDRQVRSALDSGSHVAIHGESKHGKSWLRARTLPAKKIARAQIVPGMTAGGVLEDALSVTGAAQAVSVTVEVSREHQTEGKAGVSVRGKGLAARRTRKIGRKRTIASEPVGEGPAHLNWIAAQFRGKRTPVFEDFHNLDDDEQFAMAFIIKALGELGVPCVVVGIWTDTHLLKLYNGELDGRIQDIKLRWTHNELQEVARNGCRALNVELADEMYAALASDAYTSVGLLVELTKATLRQAGIERRALRRTRLAEMTLVRRARTDVIEQISSRFDPFVERLPDAKGEGLRDGLLHNLVGAVTAGRFSEQDLLDGVPLDVLYRELSIDDSEMTRDDLREGLQGLEGLQRSVDVRPAVLAFDPARQRLILADRRILLYLRGRSFSSR